MAQLTIAAWKALYGNTGTVFPDNTTGEISEGDMRTFGENAADTFQTIDVANGLIRDAATTGTNTYAATVLNTSKAILLGGNLYMIRFSEASTGASTLNINASGAKKIFINPTTQADTGDLTDEQVYLLIYQTALDGGAGGYLMIGSSGGGGAVDSVNGQTGVVVLDAGDVGADPAGSAATVAGNLTAHINDTTDAHDASAISFAAAGTISATDVQAAIVELDGETSNGRAAVDTTGTAISFATPQIYGSVGSPETGDITIVTTGLVKGMTQLLIHNNGTEPTYGSEIQIITGSYMTGVINYIMLMAVSSTLVLVTISQELA